VSDTVLDKIAEDIEGYEKSVDDVTNSFYAFEPWDIDKREQWVYDLALEDSVDLNAEQLLKSVGDVPRQFQTGYLFSDAFLRCLFAGTQIGKSISSRMDMLICLTGEIPISMRYDKGFDTNVKRPVDVQNIERWGRRDARTGSVLDFDSGKRIDPLSWDCGNIIGAGVYPQKKILDTGGIVWVGTYMRAMLSYWWPDLYGKTRIIPPHFIDTSRGNDGYSVQDRQVYLIRDSQIAIITFEAGFARFEAKMVDLAIVDEEPPDERIFQAIQQHSRAVSLVETPYQGITWSRPYMFPEVRTKEHQIFHATQFDSPYQAKKDILMRRDNMPVWERGSRIWGIPTEATGEPYFQRDKVMFWIGKWKLPTRYCIFTPSEEYEVIVSENGRTGLMDVKSNANKSLEENDLNVWRVYEERREGTGYVVTVDPAEGGDTPETAGDRCCAQIWRLPRGNEDRPVLCAALDSTLETVPFARHCLLAARHYNNALMGAETKRSYSNATFYHESKDYPYWYQMSVTNSASGRTKMIKGFDTNAKTRGAMFDLIGKWLGDYTKEDNPKLYDLPLLKEIAAAVKGKGGRCDHTSQGSLDRAVCFGIFLYIYENSPDQIVCNDFKKVEKGWVETMMGKVKPEKPTHIGTFNKEWRHAS
jgi:phage terminase large subunit-like protein